MDGPNKIEMKWNETKGKSNVPKRIYVRNERISVGLCVRALNSHQEMSCEMYRVCVPKDAMNSPSVSVCYCFLHCIVHIAFSCWQNQSYKHTKEENKTLEHSRDCLLGLKWINSTTPKTFRTLSNFFKPFRSLSDGGNGKMAQKKNHYCRLLLRNIITFIICVERQVLQFVVHFSAQNLTFFLIVDLWLSSLIQLRRMISGCSIENFWQTN